MSDLSDAEAFLEPGSGEVPVRGGLRRTLCTFGFIASALGMVVALELAVSGRFPLREMLSIRVEGHMSKDIVSRMFRAGVMVNPVSDPKQCWAVGFNHDLVLHTCDETSKSQLFELRNFHTVIWEGECLMATSGVARFAKCDSKDRKQMFQLPQQGANFGEIYNCQCTSQADCRKSCEGAGALIANEAVEDFPFRLTAMTGTTFKWTFEVGDDGKGGDIDYGDDVALSTHFRIGVYVSPSSPPEECWAVGGVGGRELVLEACHKFEDSQVFEWRHQQFVWGGKCLVATNEHARFVDCNSGDEKQMFQLPQRGPPFGQIHNCHCASEASCMKDCIDSTALALRSGSRSLHLVSKGSSTFEWFPVKAKVPCTKNGEDCRKSKCCSEAGMSCYEKNEHWASCNQTCSPYMLWNGTGWAKQREQASTCKMLSSAFTCANDGEDCSESRCCLQHGSKCFRKDNHWASCNKTCSTTSKWVEKGWQEQKEHVWDCIVLQASQWRESRELQMLP